MLCNYGALQHVCAELQRRMHVGRMHIAGNAVNCPGTDAASAHRVHWQDHTANLIGVCKIDHTAHSNANPKLKALQ